MPFSLLLATVHLNSPSNCNVQRIKKKLSLIGDDVNDDGMKPDPCRVRDSARIRAGVAVAEAVQ